MSKRIFLSMFVILMAAAAMGGATLAWFTDATTPINNVFIPGTVSIEADETVSWDGTIRQNWNPGDCDWKEFEITNEGSKSIYLRGKVTGKWYTSYDVATGTGTLWTDVPPLPAGASWSLWSTTSGLYNPAHWQELSVAGEKWVYYKGPQDGVIAGTYTSTNPVDVNLKLKVCLNGPETENVFQDKIFVLSIQFEAIQSTHNAVESWGVKWQGGQFVVLP